MRLGPVNFHRILKTAIPAPAFTAFFWLTRANEVSLTQVAIALALLYIPWISYLGWKKRGREVVPLFAMIAFMYWLCYAVPLFWTDRIISDVSTPGGREVPERAITLAILMALLGVCALWIGMKTRAGRMLRLTTLSGVGLRPTRLNYLRALLMVCCLLSFSENLPLALGEGARQAIVTLIFVVPALAFVVLLRRYMRGEAKPVDKHLLLFFLATRLLTGLSSGWLGAFAAIILICAAVYIAEQKKLPRLVSVIAIVFILFFQVGKEDFRKVYWMEEARPTGKIERVVFWTDASLTKWSQVASNPSGESVREALNPSISRVSLLTQAANVINQTPSVVPYQFGRLYSYMMVTFIPRLLWPDKPSVNEANQFYQVAYGLTTEEDLRNVSISVGVLAEGYINFGWPGAIAIMFLLGVFFDVYQKLFFDQASGRLMTAMGIVLLPQMLAIESQLAVYLGGIVQQILFTLLVFSPVMALRQASTQLDLSNSYRAIVR